MRSFGHLEPAVADVVLGPTPTLFLTKLHLTNFVNFIKQNAS
jgi:hypothetical protein